MRHGTQLAPDGSVPASHELARCAVCQSILYDVPVLLDGCPIGKVAFRCPHCDDRRALDPVTIARHTSQQQHEAEALAEQEYRRAHIERMRLARARRDQTTDPQTRAECMAALQAWYREHGRTPTYEEMGSTGPVAVPGLPSRALTRRLFGTFRDMVLAAGLPARPNGRQTGQDTPEVAA